MIKIIRISMIIIELDNLIHQLPSVEELMSRSFSVSLNILLETVLNSTKNALLGHQKILKNNEMEFERKLMKKINECAPESAESQILGSLFQNLKEKNKETDRE